MFKMEFDRLMGIYFEYIANHLQHVAVSAGIAEGDMKKLSDIIEVVPDIKFICLDVANGYSEHFVQFVRDVRKKFPNKTIMASCVFFYYKF